MVIRVLRFLESLSSRRLISLLLASCLVVGALDFLTGPQIGFSLFYLIPVGAAAWFRGKAAGIAFSFLGAIIWLIFDVLDGDNSFHSSIYVWNGLIRLGFFLIVTFLVASLRQAKREREQLLHFVVHDLRSPLANIWSGLHLLQDDEDDSHEISRSEIFSHCERSAELMMKLIDSILDVARLGDPKMPVELVELDGQVILAESARTIAALAQSAGVRIVVEPGEPNLVYGDLNLCTRILVNILSNAIRFTAAGREIRLRCVPHGSRSVLFEVRDQGRGIPQELIPKVVVPFFQAERGNGSGIGLAFVNLALSRQGGRMWIESDIGKGTTVSFTLPAAHPQATSPRDAA